MSQKLQPGKKIIYRREAKKTFAELAIGYHRSVQPHVPIRHCESQLLTHRHPARRARQRPPFPIAHLFSEQHFHFACASRTHPKQPCWDHAAVVQHQHIPFTQQLGQLVKPRVLPCSAGSIEDQHTALPAFRRRFLRDQLWRKLEVEVGDQHRPDCMKDAAKGGILREGEIHGDDDSCSG